MVTPGQPVGNDDIVQCTLQDGQCVILIEAGRHGSTYVLDWFNSGLTGYNMVNMILSFDDGKNATPQLLNFAAMLNLQFEFSNGTTITLNEVQVGQGHTQELSTNDLINNWCIAYADWSQDLMLLPALKVSGVPQEACFIPDNESADVITVLAGANISAAWEYARCPTDIFYCDNAPSVPAPFGKSKTNKKQSLNKENITGERGQRSQKESGCMRKHKLDHMHKHISKQGMMHRNEELH